MSDIGLRKLIPVTYLPTTVSRGAPLDQSKNAMPMRYDSGQTFTFSIPPQNAMIESMMLRGSVCITDPNGYEITFHYDQNAGTIGLDGGAGALGLFGTVIMYRGSTATILSSKNAIARNLKYTALTKHQDDMIGHTNGIYVAPHLENNAVDPSSLPQWIYKAGKSPAFSGMKPFYFNPPLGVLNAGKGLNLAASGGLNISFTVENAFNLLRSYFTGKPYFENDEEHDTFVNPMQNNPLKVKTSTSGITGNSYVITIMNPTLVVLLKSIEQETDPTDNFAFAGTNLLLIQEATSLKQSINYTLPPSLIEDFVITTNYKNRDGNLSYGANFSNGQQLLDAQFYLNGLIQNYAYPTIAYPTGEQKFSSISNAIADAISFNPADQYNFTPVTFGKYYKLTTSGMGTGTSFNNTGVAIRLSYNPLTELSGRLPYLPNLPLSSDNPALSGTTYADGRNCISFGPDFSARFCVYTGTQDYFRGQGYVTDWNRKGLVALGDESYPTYQTPNMSYVGALPANDDFNLAIVTNQLFTLTLNPAATVTLPIAPVPVVIPEILIFKTCAGVSPVQLTQELQIPARKIPDPPPNTEEYEFILPTAGFIEDIILNIVPKIRIPSDQKIDTPGWCYITNLAFIGINNTGLLPADGQTKYTNSYTSSAQGNPLLSCHYGTTTNSIPQNGRTASTPYKPQAMSYTGISTYLASINSPLQCVDGVDVRGAYLNYHRISRNYSLANQLGFSSTLGALTMIRGLEVTFPTGVVATFDNVQDQALLENIVGDPFLPTVQASTLLNDYYVKDPTRDKVKDCFDRLTHIKFPKKLSVFPVSSVGKTPQEKLMSDYPSYAPHMIRISIQHRVTEMLQNTPLSANLRIYLRIRFDKRYGLCFAQASAGLGCGLFTEADVKQYALGILGSPGYSNSSAVKNWNTSCGLPLMTNFEYDIESISSTMLMAYFSASSQSLALQNFNTRGITQSFDLIDFQHRLRTNNSPFASNIELIDEINQNTQISIANQKITSTRILHRALYRDVYNDFTPYVSPLENDRDYYGRQILSGATKTSELVIPFFAMYPYAPTEDNLLSTFSMSLTDAGTTFQTPSFMARMLLPPYVSSRRGGIGYSLPYAILPKTDFVGFAQQNFEPLATFLALGDGLSMQPDLPFGTSATNQIMYSLLKGRTMFGQPEDFDFNPFRTVDYPETHHNISKWVYTVPVNRSTAPINGVYCGISAINCGWAMSSEVFQQSITNVAQCPWKPSSNPTGSETLKGYLPLYNSVPMLPSLFVTYVTFPPEFDNTVYFELRCSNLTSILPSKPILNWLTGFPVDKTILLDLEPRFSTQTEASMPITMVVSQFYPALMTNLTGMIRSYAFMRQEDITYSPVNASIVQNFPGGYSITS
jgi:hypothetical protein